MFLTFLKCPNWWYLQNNALFEKITNRKQTNKSVYHDICKLDAARIIKKNCYGTAEFDIKNDKTELKSYGHAELAVNLLIKHEKEIIEELGNIDIVKFIVGNHMRMKQYYEMGYNKQYLLISNPNYLKLALFNKADDMLFDFENTFKHFKKF